MDWKYIDDLNQIYNEYFFRYDKGPLVIINTNDIGNTLFFDIKQFEFI